jgi:hypothetical protein
MTDRKKFEEFLKEYEALCKKHKLFVASCGCCFSPWIVEDGWKPTEGTIEEHIEHLREEIKET